MREPPPPQQSWRNAQPPDRAWKPRHGLTRAARSAEQDRAAGGAHRRVVLDSEQERTGSISLRLYARTRRIRAYLRWSENGKTRERYVGEVDQNTRAANLAQAWERARSAGLVRDACLPADSRASSTAVRAVMRANKGKDTEPERRLRSLLHSQGYRYRVNTRPIPGLRRTADMVFTAARVAVFVDGCFWHGCPDHYRPATRNSAFWQEKIEANRARDEETNRLLEKEGWTVVRVWEHEELDTAAAKIVRFLQES